jgi:hypothetical protein
MIAEQERLYPPSPRRSRSSPGGPCHPAGASWQVGQSRMARNGDSRYLGASEADHAKNEHVGA